MLLRLGQQIFIIISVRLISLVCVISEREMIKVTHKYLHDQNCKYIGTLPVGRQLVGDETSRDLSYDVAPEEGAVDQSHCLWVPVKLSFLQRKRGVCVNFTNKLFLFILTCTHTHTALSHQIKGPRELILHLKNRGPVDKDSVVVDHLNNGHTEVAPDAKGDAEAQTTEDGNDVALGQTSTATVQKRGRTWRCCHWTPILCQLKIVFFFYITAIDFPKTQITLSFY